MKRRRRERADVSDPLGSTGGTHGWVSYGNGASGRSGPTYADYGADHFRADAADRPGGGHRGFTVAGGHADSGTDALLYPQNRGHGFGRYLADAVDGAAADRLL